MYIYGQENPTGKLRFVERKIELTLPYVGTRTARILQQEVVVQGKTEKIEWRDVPVEIET